jgi:hypothetical protein
MSQQPAALPEALVDYFAKREAQRMDAVAAMWTGLTEREQGLVHDAAVMGYVQGVRHPEGEPIGKDRQTIALVLDACLSFPDLYPTITGWTPADDEDDGEQPC